MKPIRRFLVLIVGSVVSLAGAVMLVTPGPGIAVILLGLTILATEFRWARYWLVLAKRRTLAAARRIKQRTRRGHEPGTPQVDQEGVEEPAETTSDVAASKAAAPLAGGEGDPR